MFKCVSLEEAWRWACVISLMTFDYCKNTHVKLFTCKMLEDPLFVMKIWRVWEAYHISPPVENKTHPKYVNKLPHSGLLLDPVEKDFIEGSYKKLVYADKTERYYYNPNDKTP